MKKDAYYFPHFCNARSDRKIKRLKKDLGIEGYGIYFMTLEVLREQTEFKYPITDVDLLADEFGTSEAKLTAVISKYDLFEIDLEQNFFSPKLMLYLQPYIEKSERARIAAQTRWNKVKKDANAYANALPEHSESESKCNANQNASKGEESKGEESKLKDINTLVTSEKITIPYDDILELYNTFCVSLPKVKMLNENRKKRIKSIYLKEAEQNIIFFNDLFIKIENSDFLTGRSSDWNATFDWVIKPANLIKILEDNYINKNKSTDDILNKLMREEGML